MSGWKKGESWKDLLLIVVTVALWLTILAVVLLRHR
jgi:uncharacterized membrane-anchored protein